MTFAKLHCAVAAVFGARSKVICLSSMAQSNKNAAERLEMLSRHLTSGASLAEELPTRLGSSVASVMRVNKRDVYAWLVRDHVEMREAIYEFLKVQNPSWAMSIKAALVWVSYQ